MTLEEAKAHNEAVEKKRGSYAARISGKAHAVEQHIADTIATDPQAKVGILATGGLSVIQREGRKAPKLNKTETLWKQELERRGHKIIIAQQITFKLANGVCYRPDLVTIDIPWTGVGFSDRRLVEITCWETKAPHRFAKASLAKPKLAAKEFPWIRWKLIRRDKNIWTEEEIME